MLGKPSYLLPHPALQHILSGNDQQEVGNGIEKEEIIACRTHDVAFQQGPQRPLEATPRTIKPSEQFERAPEHPSV